MILAEVECMLSCTLSTGQDLENGGQFLISLYWDMLKEDLPASLRWGKDVNNHLLFTASSTDPVRNHHRDIS